MKTPVCLPHLDPSGRSPHPSVAVVLLGGTYGLVLAMLWRGIAPEVCVATTAAVTALAAQAVRSVLSCGASSGPSDPAAQPPRL